MVKLSVHLGVTLMAFVVFHLANSYEFPDYPRQERKYA